MSSPNAIAPTITRSRTPISDWLKNKQLAIFDSIKEAEELGYEPYKSGPQRTLMDEAEIESRGDGNEPTDFARLPRSAIAC